MRLFEVQLVFAVMAGPKLASSLRISRVLVMFDTRDGQTEKIANKISRNIQEMRINVDTMNINDTKDIELNYDAILLGGPIHWGSHTQSLSQFVKSNNDKLNNIPTAFFSVSLAASGDEREQAKAQEYLDDFLKSSTLMPLTSTTMAGALKYPKYNLLLRWTMKTIVAYSGRSEVNDLSRVYEYTDWSQVDKFTESFIHNVSQI